MGYGKAATNRQDPFQDKKLCQFFHHKDRMPSYSEIGEIIGLRSKNVVHKLVSRLQQNNVLSKDEKGSCNWWQEETPDLL